MIQIIRCPCCGDEIPIQIDGDDSNVVTIVDLDEKLLANNFGIELGAKGGDKKIE